MPNPIKLENGDWETTHPDGSTSQHPTRNAGRDAKKLPTSPQTRDKFLGEGAPWDNNSVEPETPTQGDNESPSKGYVYAANSLKNVAGSIVGLERDVYGNLTPPQADAIIAIANLTPVRQKELAESLSCTGGNVTMLVDNLEKARLAKRERCSEDRRNIYVTLTEKGEKRVNDIQKARCEVADKVFDGMGSKDLKSLNRLLNKLAVN